MLGLISSPSAEIMFDSTRPHALFLFLLHDALWHRDLCNPDEPNDSHQTINDAVKALYNLRDSMARSCVAALDEVLKVCKW